MLTVMMMNQTNFFTQPFEMRSRVIANDVLLHTVARTETNPAAYEYMTTSVKFSGRMSPLALPSPRLTQSDCSDAETTRATWGERMTGQPHAISQSTSPSVPNTATRGGTHPARNQDVVVPPQ